MPLLLLVHCQNVSKFDQFNYKKVYASEQCNTFHAEEQSFIQKSCYMKRTGILNTIYLFLTVHSH
jgi:hypothetical protein